MDPPKNFRYDNSSRIYPCTQDVSTIDQQVYQATVRRRPATRSSPTSQPISQSRPRDFGTFIASNSHISTLHRTQSTGPGFRRDVPATGLAASKPKRRPRPLDQERLRQPSDATLLYPQMSPYSQPYDDSAYAFDYYPRSVSQPVTPGLINASNTAHEAHSSVVAMLEPAPGAIGCENVPIPNDAAFDDEHEFRLFVEATAGLESVSNIDQQRFSSESSRSPPVDVPAVQRAETFPLGSPVAETPNTVRALQHLAQMPQSTLPSQLDRPQLQSFGSNFDIWLQAPPPPSRLTQQHSMPLMSAHVSPDNWQDMPDAQPIEEELPDYAASQAQAQASQRMEATRRAQELQRRWQESGSRVIRLPYD